MTSDQIRETFLEFFGRREHRRLPSASLVPTTHDPSVLLTTAGMHPLKPYFLGEERPPATRLTSCQKCFRATDIENVGNTARHLTFFEMLGNFSIGDYFKREAIEAAYELSLEGFGFDSAQIWVTVFEGDAELGIGPDEEAIAIWEEVGIPRERIVLCPRSENFWQAGPTGPCGPCSELYLDRGVEFGSADDLPGGDNERFLEYWNLVFMQFNQDVESTLTPLPAKNIDTGLGLNRMAAILQGVPSVFDTDQFRPLVELGEQLSGRSYESDFKTTRALRILADHARAMNFLLADGVVSSNEDRGYILRRVMRRAIQQGRTLEIEGPFLARYQEVVLETMGTVYPELGEQRSLISEWLAAEEEGFGRTLEQGSKLLDELIERVKAEGDTAVPAVDVFKLHDTFGFPFELTTELVAEHGLAVDGAGFESLMNEQRTRARASVGRSDNGSERELAAEFVRSAGFATEFVGYEKTEQATTVGAVHKDGDRTLVKLVESPFYPAGGGQVSDLGSIRCQGDECSAEIEEVFRVGDDQAVAVKLERGELKEGEQVLATVDRRARVATAANHTATHLLQAALQERLGDHVRQAGSAVRPDKLRFDFTHQKGLTEQELRDVEDRVNEWITDNYPVSAITTTLDEAKRLGAMALFGEKYGEIVRMVEVGDGSFSRELCGGTHVHSTAEIGLFKITTETSSAANVRRIEALTGPEAVRYMRERDAELDRAQNEIQTLKKKLKKSPSGSATSVGVDAAELVSAIEQIGDVSVLVRDLSAQEVDQEALMQLIDALRDRASGDLVAVLGSVSDARVHLVASVAPSLIQCGIKAGELVKLAAEITGGGGGGKDTLARAGGRDPSKLEEALAAVKTEIRNKLES